MAKSGSATNCTSWSSQLQGISKHFKVRIRGPDQHEKWDEKQLTLQGESEAKVTALEGSDQSVESLKRGNVVPGLPGSLLAQLLIWSF